MYFCILLMFFVFGVGQPIPISTPTSNDANLYSDMKFESSPSRNDSMPNSSVEDIVRVESFADERKIQVTVDSFTKQVVEMKNITINNNSTDNDSTVFINREGIRKLLEKIKLNEVVDKSKDTRVQVSTASELPKNSTTIFSSVQATVNQLPLLAKILEMELAKGNANNFSNNISNISEAITNQQKHQSSLVDTLQRTLIENASNGPSREAKFISSSRPIDPANIEDSNSESIHGSQIDLADKKGIDFRQNTTVEMNLANIDSIKALPQNANKTKNDVTTLSGDFSVTHSTNGTMLKRRKVEIISTNGVLPLSTNKLIITNSADNTSLLVPTASFNQMIKPKTIKNKFDSDAAEWTEDYRSYTGSRITEVPKLNTSDAFLMVEGDLPETLPVFYPAVMPAMHVLRNAASLPTRVEPFFWYIPDYYSMSAIPYSIFHRQRSTSFRNTDTGSQSRTPRLSF